MDISHRKEQITLPGLSFKERQIAYIKVLSPMIKSERAQEDQDGRKPATVMKVLNLQDNLKYRLICPALLISSLQDEGDSYVGKCYEIHVSSKVKPGKNYKEVMCYEIDSSVDYTLFPVLEDDDSESDKDAGT